MIRTIELVTLFEGERIIDRLDTLILTTHRVREGTDCDFTSIMLEEVCSISIEHVAKTWLLVLGISLIAGIAVTAEYRKIPLDVVLQIGAPGVVLIVCYFVTRFRVVQIASAARRIYVRLPRRKKKAESVLQLIDTIELAKSERMTISTEGHWQRTT